VTVAVACHGAKLEVASLQFRHPWAEMVIAGVKVYQLNICEAIAAHFISADEKRPACNPHSTVRQEILKSR
jgi:hypothetical protein